MCAGANFTCSVERFWNWRQGEQNRIVDICSLYAWIYSNEKRLGHVSVQGLIVRDVVFLLNIKWQG